MTVANKNEEMVWRAWRIEMAGPTTFARAATHVGSVSVREGPIAHQSDASQGAAAKKSQREAGMVQAARRKSPSLQIQMRDLGAFQRQVGHQAGVGQHHRLHRIAGV